MLLMVVFFIAFRCIYLSTPIISFFLLVLILRLMPTLNFLPVWFALILLRFRLPGRLHMMFILFFFSSRRRHTRSKRDWSSDVCSSDLRALRGLAGFAKALKVKYQDIEVGLDFDPEPGLADNADLEHDLQALFEVAADAASRAKTALVLFIDELQYVTEDELAALITALHRTAQRRLPMMLVGAGLP